MNVTYSGGDTTVTYTDYQTFIDPQELTDEQRIRYFYAEVVSVCRQLAGWTQEELAKRVGTNQAVISRMEKGEWQSLKSMQKVLRQFNLNLKLDFKKK